jgi:hypothetical protein
MLRINLNMNLLSIYIYIYIYIQILFDHPVYIDGRAGGQTERYTSRYTDRCVYNIKAYIETDVCRVAQSV